MPVSSSTTAGAGLGMIPCAARTMPRPTATGEEVMVVDAEHLECGAGADDVDDGVDPADLVEVDLVRRPAVQAALGLGEGLEHGRCTLLDPLGEAGLGDEALDVRAVRTTVESVACTCTLVPAMPPRSTGSASSGQSVTGGGRGAPHLVEVGAGVDERPSAMSPAMPEKQWNQAMVTKRLALWWTPRCRRRGGWPGFRNMRATAQAAPYPLSMPTTVMPAAHEASMPSSAVTPSRPAP
jgi:hypothetical protein